MTTNPAVELACQAQFIQRYFCRHPGGEMATLIALIAQLGGIMLDCPTLANLSSQYSCLPRQTQLPALIYLVSLIVNGQVTPSGSLYSGIGSPVGVIAPISPVAMYFDITIPAAPIVWNWAAGNWNELIG